MLEVKGLVKRYDQHLAVNQLSFEARQGAIFGIIGPNGAGKSSTIRMIMNIIAPDEGSIFFDSKQLDDKLKERIGYLPEERGLYKKVKVSEMLHYLGSLKGMDKASCEKSMNIWLERFGLQEWKHHKIEQLSKGMAQKVQFIASIIHDPDLVLFDEPFSGLDPVSQEVLLEVFNDLRAKGKTILFSTHIMEHAEKVCNEILLINKGVALVQGELSAVKSHYGSNTVVMEYDGDAGFVKQLPFVRELSMLPRHLEVTLDSADDADALLKSVVGKLKIQKFELVAPSLHKIFIDLVKKGSV